MQYHLGEVGSQQPAQGRIGGRNAQLTDEQPSDLLDREQVGQRGSPGRLTQIAQVL